MSHVYDLAGRETARQFTSPAGVMIAAFTSTYDAVGNRLSLAEMQVVSGVTQALLTSYAYDSGDQLLSETASGSAPYSYLYSYDRTGNRLSRVFNGQPTTWTYGPMNQVASQTAYPTTLTHFGYDLDGNLLTATQNGALSTYTWDVKGTLQSVQTNAALSTFSYNFDGWRMRSDTAGQDSTFYAFDGENVFQEYDVQTGGLAAHYTTTPDDDAIGLLYSQRLGSLSQFYGFDVAGNARLLFDSTGAITDTLRYSAFGELLNRTGTSALKYQFGGAAAYQTLDGRNALAKARYLAMYQGTWLSQDPIGFQGGDLNLMRYVANNPGRWLDPYGTKQDCDKVSSETYADCMAYIRKHGRHLSRAQWITRRISCDSLALTAYLACQAANKVEDLRRGITHECRMAVKFTAAELKTIAEAEQRLLAGLSSLPGQTGTTTVVVGGSTVLVMCIIVTEGICAAVLV